MSGIGSVNFDIIRGLPEELKLRTETWEVPGIDGVGAMTLGLGDGRFELRAIVYCDDSDAADVVIGTSRAMQGTLISLVDDWGRLFENVIVEHVDTRDAKKAVVHEGNFNAVRVEIGFLLCATAVQS